MLLARALKDFLDVHQIDNQSGYTLRNYRMYVSAFIAWLESEQQVTEASALTVAHLRGWIAHLQQTPSKRGKPRAESTIHLCGVSMLAFCHWLEEEGYIEHRVTARFKLPRMEKKFIPTYTTDDVKKLFEACEEQRGFTPVIRKALTSRNRAMLAVLLDAGIRLAEMVSLRLRDVDRDLHLLVVHRKGNKWQQVPISREAFKYLHEYLAKHRKHLAAIDGVTKAQKDDAVFLSHLGKPMTRSGVQMFFRRLRNKTGIQDKCVGAHNCRRYMATTQLAMGRSPLDVQRQMGHTSLTMTNHYASLTVEQLQRSHEQFSPLRAKHQEPNESSESGYWDEE
jgi:site-specific recombinase XerD